jgi:hypothetical protein
VAGGDVLACGCTAAVAVLLHRWARTLRILERTPHHIWAAVLLKRSGPSWL